MNNNQNMSPAAPWSCHFSLKLSTHTQSNVIRYITSNLFQPFPHFPPACFPVQFTGRIRQELQGIYNSQHKYQHIAFVTLADDTTIKHHSCRLKGNGDKLRHYIWIWIWSAPEAKIIMQITEKWAPELRIMFEEKKRTISYADANVSINHFYMSII